MKQRCFRGARFRPRQCWFPLLALMAGIGLASGRSIGEADAWAAQKQAALPEPTVLTLKTADGWTIAGDLYVPSGKSAGTVILLHQRGGQASDWTALCRALQKAGLAALALDQRGAGRSGQGPGGKGDDAPWATSGDIAAAVASRKGKGAIGLAGASYGANNALIYAAAHPTEIKALALFSPGLNYHGLDALAPAKTYKGALVIYHDKGDAIAGNGPQKINAASPSASHALRLSNGSEHGTNLLSPTTLPDAVTFFQRTLK